MVLIMQVQSIKDPYPGKYKPWSYSFYVVSIKLQPNF